MASLIAFIPIPTPGYVCHTSSDQLLDFITQDFAGRPLFYWALRATCDSPSIDQVVVATSSTRIKDLILGWKLPKISIFSPSMASQMRTSSVEDLTMEYFEKNPCKQIIFVQAGQPFLRSDDLQWAFESYGSGGFDSLLSVVRAPHFTWREGTDHIALPLHEEPRESLLRSGQGQQQGDLIENGAFYITSYSSFMKSRQYLSGKVGFYAMGPATYLSAVYALNTGYVGHQFEMSNKDRCHGPRRLDGESLECLLRRLQIQHQIKNKDIQLFVTDVDGVLTDAGLYYGTSGKEMRKFNTKDGQGIKLLQGQGVKTAILTAGDTEVVARRGKELKFDYVFQGIQNKPMVLKKLLDDSNISPEHVAYIGDDTNDTKAMEMVGLAFTPQDGCEENKNVAHYICANKGGQGCVREACEVILSLKMKK